jgi:hypothetical protein
MGSLPGSQDIKDNLEDFLSNNIVSRSDFLEGLFDMKIVAFPWSVETKEHVEHELYAYPSLKGKSNAEYVLSSDLSEKKSKR